MRNADNLRFDGNFVLPVRLFGPLGKELVGVWCRKSRWLQGVNVYYWESAGRISGSAGESVFL